MFGWQIFGLIFAESGGKHSLVHFVIVRPLASDNPDYPGIVRNAHSHSIVAGGFDDMSYTTLPTWDTLFVIADDMPMRSWAEKG